jgi:hypothetical protein
MIKADRKGKASGLENLRLYHQEVDNISRLAVGIAVYDEFFSCMCATEFVCALDVYARHTSSGITFLALTIVGRPRGDVSSQESLRKNNILS